MKYAIQILASPVSSQGATTALRFTEACLAAGHEITRVFFYHDGVYCANRFITPPQDLPSIPKQWQQLQETHELDLVVCIGSALKRGVVDAGEADRYELGADNLQPGFNLSGLGQWVDACIEADRVVSFGP